MSFIVPRLCMLLLLLIIFEMVYFIIIMIMLVCSIISIIIIIIMMMRIFMWTSIKMSLKFPWLLHFFLFCSLHFFHHGNVVHPEYVVVIITFKKYLLIVRDSTFLLRITISACIELITITFLMILIITYNVNISISPV